MVVKESSKVGRVARARLQGKPHRPDVQIVLGTVEEVVAIQLFKKGRGNCQE